MCFLRNILSAGEIGNRTLTAVMQTQNTTTYIISPLLSFILQNVRHSYVNHVVSTLLSYNNGRICHVYML